MKIEQLLNAAAIALLQCGSADAAFEFGGLLTSEKKNNKNGNNNCGNGFDDGRDAMRERWEDVGENCDDAWNLDDEADDVKDSFPNDGIGRCARQGVDAELQAIEKECFEDSPDQCIGLGRAAATQIAYREACLSGAAPYAAGKPDYKEQCREMAIQVCEGGVSTVIASECPDDMPNASGLGDLMDMCEDQVDDLLGNGGGGTDPGECVDDDSPRPTRNGQRFRFKLVESDAQCVDADGQPYEYGEWRNSENFSACAEMCVNDTPDALAEKDGSFRGYDYDCAGRLCRCLYDEGTLDNRNSGRFDRTNRNAPGSGSIGGTTRRRSHYCAKLAGAAALEGEGMMAEA